MAASLEQQIPVTSSTVVLYPVSNPVCLPCGFLYRRAPSTLRCDSKLPLPVEPHSHSIYPLRAEYSSSRTASLSADYKGKASGPFPSLQGETPRETAARSGPESLRSPEPVLTNNLRPQGLQSQHSPCYSRECSPLPRRLGRAFGPLTGAVSATQPAYCWRPSTESRWIPAPIGCCWATLVWEPPAPRATSPVRAPPGRGPRWGSAHLVGRDEGPIRTGCRGAPFCASSREASATGPRSRTGQAAEL
eukprot:scaffold207_cov409-Prasinococcus_capsulatus_cf.AAC.85